jgi:small conductance mechanosensitive channel
MTLLEHATAALSDWLPTLEVVVVGGLILLASRWLLLREAKGGPPISMTRSLLFSSVVGGVLISLILALPVGDSAKGQLLSLFGLLITGAIALSSTTFVGNAMAGLMLRSMGNFRPGDFVKVGDHFGRVSAVSLVHTEIQTEDRDLTTFSNIYLVTNPVTVVRASGTIISSTVSLGYDVPRADVEEALVDAAGRSELADPFVQVRELGDFSITYRVCGFLADVKYLISNRTKLHCNVLDALHERRIEIVSPNFVNYRDVGKSPSVIPRSNRRSTASDDRSRPEDVMFDKADRAEARIFMEGQLQQVREELRAMSERLDKEESHTAELENELERLRLKEQIIGQALEGDDQGEH